jgi:hypothetical protein
MTDVSGHISIGSISSQMQEHIPNRKRTTFRSMLFPFAFVITRLQSIIFITQSHLPLRHTIHQLQESVCTAAVKTALKKGMSATEYITSTGYN